MHQAGVLDVNGVEVRYMSAADCCVSQPIRYVDTFELLPLFHRMCFDPRTSEFDPPNILLSGPKGTGKSLLFAHLAATNRVPCLSLDCSEDTRDRRIRGGFIASREGTTPFVLGTVANAIQVANETGFAMLVLEEINALSPQTQKDINPLTDFRKKIEIPEIPLRLELRPGAKLWVCATMNPSGPYGGTYELNEDLKSRFVEIEVPYPPAAAEKRILQEMVPAAAPFGDAVLDSLIRLAAETRQTATGYALSPRDLVQILTLVPRVGWEDALFLAGQKFSSEDRALILERISDITRIGVYSDLKQRVLRGGTA